LCNRSTEALDLDVVREAASPVDLDDREPLAVFGLERLVAGDVDLAQGEAELSLELPKLPERPFAEVAALGVIDDDVGGYG
jgi:hypothetical protein